MNATPHEARLAHALAGPCGPGDLVALVRAVARQTQRPVPISASAIRRVGVTADHWHAASTQATANGPNWLVTASPWRPAWLGEHDFDSLFSERDPRRSEASVPADPPVRRWLGHEHYQSDAQRQAARVVLAAPSGATVVVNLPTGSGKTLCGLLPGLIHSDNLPGVTPFVVPTVALMLDLERRLQHTDPEYRSAYRPDEPDDADHVRQRCRVGTQGPVFVSPESLVGSLRHSLRLAARAGHLRYLVVDEAHMVGAWGDDFRPAFQRIADLRRELLAEARDADRSPFTTVLMSATLPQHRLQQLRELFGQPGPLCFVHAVRLRPEPTYAIAEAPTHDDRQAWILEAVRHLPRPLILYTVRRADASRWHRTLNAAGFLRIGLMHGNTDADTRARLLAAWSDNTIDVMVATAAFGLGVDKSDVRAVIHAALPESVDRFYQEVGRCGRDGRASLSLLVWHLGDWRTARALASPTLITEQRGRERWEAMFAEKRPINTIEHRYRVSLTTRPAARPDDLDMEGDEHEAWNLRTLLLLRRAGLIELDWPHSDDPREDARPTPTDLAVRLLRPHDPAVWWTLAEQVRERILGPAEAGVRLLNRLARANECIADILHDCYRSADPDVPVVQACGGCPACRANDSSGLAGKLRCRLTPATAWPTTPVNERLTEILAGQSACLLTYRHGQEADLPRLVHWLVQQGIRWVCAGPDAVADLGDEVVFVDRQPLPVGLLAELPSLFVGTAGPELTTIWQALWHRRAVTVVVVPENTPQPDHPGRQLREMWPGARLDLDAWLERYDA